MVGKVPIYILNGGMVLKRILSVGLMVILLFTAVGCAATAEPPADGAVAWEEAPGVGENGRSDSGCKTASLDEITVFDALLQTLTPSFCEQKAGHIVPMKLNDTATHCDLQALRIENGALVATVQKTKSTNNGAKVVRWTSAAYCVDAAAVAGITGTRIEEEWA